MTLWMREEVDGEWAIPGGLRPQPRGIPRSPSLREMRYGGEEPLAGLHAARAGRSPASTGSALASSSRAGSPAVYAGSRTRRTTMSSHCAAFLIRDTFYPGPAGRRQGTRRGGTHPRDRGGMGREGCGRCRRLLVRLRRGGGCRPHGGGVGSSAACQSDPRNASATSDGIRARACTRAAVRTARPTPAVPRAVRDRSLRSGGTQQAGRIATGLRVPRQPASRPLTWPPITGAAAGPPNERGSGAHGTRASRENLCVCRLPDR